MTRSRVYSYFHVDGCFRLENQDVDFEIQISDFPIKHEIKKPILPNGNLSARCISC